MVTRLTLTERERRRALNTDDLWIGDTLIWRHKRKKPAKGQRVLRVTRMWRGDKLAQVQDELGTKGSVPWSVLKKNYQKKVVSDARKGTQEDLGKADGPRVEEVSQAGRQP